MRQIPTEVQKAADEAVQKLTKGWTEGEAAFKKRQEEEKERIYAQWNKGEVEKQPMFRAQSAGTVKDHEDAKRVQKYRKTQAALLKKQHEQAEQLEKIRKGAFDLQNSLTIQSMRFESEKKQKKPSSEFLKRLSEGTKSPEAVSKMHEKMQKQPNPMPPVAHKDPQAKSHAEVYPKEASLFSSFSKKRKLAVDAVHEAMDSAKPYKDRDPSKLRV